jgi:predicted AlkP superfamily phosphohydrolase/phosphomutase
MRRVSLAAAALGLLLCIPACGRRFVETDKKVVILGFDGVDPDLVQQYLDEGRLPNIRKLRDEGTFSALGTTYPPESPVAWASFHTGVNPGKHGIYDFLRRDPDRYIPLFTYDQTPAEFLFGIFPWRLPRVTPVLQGAPFWKITADAGIRSIAIGAPAVFPPIELPGGYMTPGLVTPDIRGTQATYHYYSTDISGEKSEDTEFGGKVTGIRLVNGSVETRILGPWDPLVRQRKEELNRKLKQVKDQLQAGGDPSLRDKRQEILDQLRDLEQDRYIEVPLRFEVDRAAHKVTVELQGQRKTIEQAHWSEWFDIRFRVTPIVSIDGICKFYPVEIGDQVKIYLSPIEMDPRHPPLPISYPSNFTAELAEHIGLYKTRGWAAETAALKELKIDEKAFLEDLYEIEDKQDEMALYTLKNKPWSFFYAYFEAPDRLEHMFWRLIDPQHPLYDPVLVEKYGNEIRKVYERMDETVGKIRKELAPGTVLFVLSDHGFHSFRTGLNINTWLVDNGFMFLKGQSEHQMNLRDLYTQQNFFINVDWSKTKAYSLGLGLIFINLQGRERLGSVAPGEEFRQVKADISAKLVALTDPKNGARVVDNVYDSERIYHGPLTGSAPDLIVGFAEGYRVSWQTALGAVPAGTLVVNDQKWSGDHCSVDAATTSGFLATNQKLAKEAPSIVDLAPTVLKIFGLPIPADFDGKPLY